MHRCCSRAAARKEPLLSCCSAPLGGRYCLRVVSLGRVPTRRGAPWRRHPRLHGVLVGASQWPWPCAPQASRRQCPRLRSPATLWSVVCHVRSSAPAVQLHGRIPSFRVAVLYLVTARLSSSRDMAAYALTRQAHHGGRIPVFVVLRWGACQYRSGLAPHRLFETVCLSWSACAPPRAQSAMLHCTWVRAPLRTHGRLLEAESLSLVVWRRGAVQFRPGLPAPGRGDTCHRAPPPSPGRVDEGSRLALRPWLDRVRWACSVQHSCTRQGSSASVLAGMCLEHRRLPSAACAALRAEEQRVQHDCTSRQQQPHRHIQNPHTTHARTTTHKTSTTSASTTTSRRRCSGSPCSRIDSSTTTTQK